MEITKDDIIELEYIADSYMCQTIAPNQDIITFMGLVISMFKKIGG